MGEFLSQKFSTSIVANNLWTQVECYGVLEAIIDVYEIDGIKQKQSGSLFVLRMDSCGFGGEVVFLAVAV